MATQPRRPSTAFYGSVAFCVAVTAIYVLAISRTRAIPSRAVAVEAGASAKRVAVAADAYDGPPGQPPVRTLLNVQQRMRYGEYRWDEGGVAAGPAWVRVDLDAQIISAFRGGHEIGTAVILHGTDGKPTPTGRFPILAKLKNHHSSLYDAAMPYTLRLTGDGIAIHGSDVRYGLATNGCIGIPEGFAIKLFDRMKLGDNVIIVRGGKKA